MGFRYLVIVLYKGGIKFYLLGYCNLEFYYLYSRLILNYWSNYQKGLLGFKQCVDGLFRLIYFKYDGIIVRIELFEYILLDFVFLVNDYVIYLRIVSIQYILIFRRCSIKFCKNLVDERYYGEVSRKSWRVVVLYYNVFWVFSVRKYR